MCLTKGPQSLGSGAELGICSQEGLLSQVLEAFQRNNFAWGEGSQEVGGEKGEGFWQCHTPQACLAEPEPERQASKCWASHIPMHRLVGAHSERTQKHTREAILPKFP